MTDTKDDIKFTLTDDNKKHLSLQKELLETCKLFLECQLLSHRLNGELIHHKIQCLVNNELTPMGLRFYQIPDSPVTAPETTQVDNAIVNG